MKKPTIIEKRPVSTSSIVINKRSDRHAHRGHSILGKGGGISPGNRGVSTLKIIVLWLRAGNRGGHHAARPPRRVKARIDCSLSSEWREETRFEHQRTCFHEIFHYANDESSFSLSLSLSLSLPLFFSFQEPFKETLTQNFPSPSSFAFRSTTDSGFCFVDENFHAIVKAWTQFRNSE